MDTRQTPESPLAAPVAPAEPLGTPVPAPLGTRRDFCVAACQALSLGAIAATLQACGGGSSPNEPSGNFDAPGLPSLNAAVANGAATLSVDGTVLSSTGGAAMVTSGLGTLLVVRTDATSVSAYSATCTHQQCTINGFTENVFQCPCHGSRFSPANGSVLRGPATAPLRRFNATLANGVVSITA
jgi:nitrite reductase/ring-hydroxylating ferredoxin subunit